MPYLLGDSFGGLQQAENAADSNRRMALSSAMNAMQSGFQSKRAADMRQEQMDQEQENWGKTFKLQQAASELAKTRVTDENARDLAREKLGQGALDLQRETLKWQKEQGTPSSQREHDMMFNRAAQDAEQGAFEKPEDVSGLYGLTPGESKALANRSVSARKQIEQNYLVASHAADTLNKHAELTSRIIPMTQEAINSVHWYSPPGSEARAALPGHQDVLKQATAAKAALDPVVAKIKNDKRLGELISYDPDSNSYTPAVPTPSWLAKPTADASLAPSANAPAGWTPTAGGGALKPIPTQTGTASPGTTPRKPKYTPWVYDRVNELHAGGMDPAAALQRSLAEEQALFSQ